ncbi:hypothetical protein CF326_g4297 [Tilletia indica]|nr:hypothetical protein CF326_g4297 [Tilletia indica]
MSLVSAPAGINTGGLDVRMPADSWALIANLQEVGGQEGYDVATATLGWMKREHYMALPKDWARPTIPVADVGSGPTGASFSLRDLAQVYALNKDRCPIKSYAAQFALLRMEAVRAGWVDISNQTEIVLVEPLHDVSALRTLAQDLETLRHKIDQVRSLGYLIPLIAEHVLRTKGHYWCTEKADVYTGHYRDIYEACLLPEFEDYLPPDLLYHQALHWTGPSRQMQVLLAQLQIPRLPGPLKTMASDPPASMDLISATAKCIKALRIGMKRKLSATYDFELIKSVAAAAENDPFKYHKLHFLYGVGPPTKDELAALRKAMEAAANMGPLSQWA